MINVFFSYSHKDEDLRNRLETHLAALRRDGHINLWHDREIKAGDNFKNEIDSNLASSDLILLLISADFISSDYCYNIEFEKALKMHERKEARIVPVILHHCDWQATQLADFLATPTDGKPITSYTNIDEAFTIVAKEIRSVVESIIEDKDLANEIGIQPDNFRKNAPYHNANHETKPQRSSNLRVKRKFSDYEKQTFLQEGYDYIKRYFSNSLSELEKRNQCVTTHFNEDGGNTFEAKIFVNGEMKSYCSISIAPSHWSNNMIRYSSNPNNGPNTMNDSLNLGDDGYIQFFSGNTGFISHQSNSNQLSNEGAAEYFWESFIRYLQ
ncbi:MAG: toll/interleukin-1 receptor domain-containing protein [Candidatus Sumerlaeia bacterium]